MRRCGSGAVAAWLGVLALVVVGCDGGGDAAPGGGDAGLPDARADAAAMDSADARDGAAGAETVDRDGGVADAAADGAADAALPPCAVTDWGPHAVGLRTFAYVDEGREGRALPTLVYYPAAPAAGPSAASGAGPGDRAGCWAAFLAADRLARLSQAAICATADAAPAAGGPWPLLVLSHGSGSQKEAHAFVAEYLASHGFVVAVPDHTGNVGFAQSSPADRAMSVTRAWDVQFVIDRALADGAPGGALAGLVDAARVGVAGHSWGGHTAAAVAGIAYSWDRIAADCAAGLEPDDWYCPLLDHRAELEERLPDPRVGAVVTWAHDCGHQVAAPDCAGAAAVTVPWLQLVGDADPLASAEDDGQDCFDRAAGPACLVVLPGAGHLGYTALGDEGTFGAERMFDLVRWYAAAFFRWHLGGEAGCEAALLALGAGGPGGGAADHAPTCRAGR